MEPIHLKVPPSRAAIIAAALERDLQANRSGQDAAELRQVLTWLRYRISLWHARHQANPRM
jgi:hypothetical protein